MKYKRWLFVLLGLSQYGLGMEGKRYGFFHFWHGQPFFLTCATLKRLCMNHCVCDRIGLRCYVCLADNRADCASCIPGCSFCRQAVLNTMLFNFYTRAEKT